MVPNKIYYSGMKEKYLRKKRHPTEVRPWARSYQKKT